MELSSSEIKDIATCRICYQCNGEADKGLISPCMCKGTQQFVHRSCLDHWRSIKEGFDFSHCTTCKAQFHIRVDLKWKIWRKTRVGLFVARDVFLLFLVLQPMIGMLGGLAYLLDIHGYLKDVLINNHWNQILSRRPIPIYCGIGVFAFFTFFVLLGLIAIQCWFMVDDTPEFRVEPYDYIMSSGYNMDNILLKCLAFFVISGILSIMIILFVATLFIYYLIQLMWEKHNHILAKKELTKEYIVEDLHGCYTPVKQDLEHLERLRTLNPFLACKVVCHTLFNTLLDLVS